MFSAAFSAAVALFFTCVAFKTACMLKQDKANGRFDDAKMSAAMTAAASLVAVLCYWGAGLLTEIFMILAVGAIAVLAYRLTKRRMKTAK